jgi:hypothetical protein
MLCSFLCMQPSWVEDTPASAKCYVSCGLIFQGFRQRECYRSFCTVCGKGDDALTLSTASAGGAAPFTRKSAPQKCNVAIIKATQYSFHLSIRTVYSNFEITALACPGHQNEPLPFFFVHSLFCWAVILEGFYNHIVRNYLSSAFQNTKN